MRSSGRIGKVDVRGDGLLIPGRGTYGRGEGEYRSNFLYRDKGAFCGPKKKR